MCNSIYQEIRKTTSMNWGVLPHMPNMFEFTSILVVTLLDCESNIIKNQRIHCRDISDPTKTKPKEQEVKISPSKIIFFKRKNAIIHIPIGAWTNKHNTTQPKEVTHINLH